jgi:hypothetical protein
MVWSICSKGFLCCLKQIDCDRGEHRSVVLKEITAHTVTSLKHTLRAVLLIRSFSSFAQNWNLLLASEQHDFAIDGNADIPA